MRAAIFGGDLLPQAVELAKLALWLTAARRNEPSADLTDNFVTGDALDPTTLSELQRKAGSQFDLILGNPPWGGVYDAAHAASALNGIGLGSPEGLDSWEVFLGLAIAALKPGGRFALLVPDTIFAAAKRRVREWLVKCTRLEKVYSLGPDWFTAEVRMGTVVLQGVKTNPDENAKVSTLLLAGIERRDALEGHRPLEQLEQIGAQSTFQSRFRANPEFQIQVLASESELDLIARIEAKSHHIADLTEHARGDELNAEGLLWRCGSCGAYTVPGEKEKGGGYKNKSCPNCGAHLSSKDVFHEPLVAGTQRGSYRAPYIDGLALTRRYESPARKFMRMDLTNLYPPLKAADVFRGPKILIRQAGVGIVATLVDDGSRCPQSLYIYRATPQAQAEGYSNEFILACLVSRTMNYVCMKKYAEVDPARAFAKLTHARIAPFPIPRLPDNESKRIAMEISLLVRKMLVNPRYGGDSDMAIETMLRRLWGISGDEGRFINGFFSTLPEGQSVADLFPDGAPVRIPFPHSTPEQPG